MFNFLFNRKASTSTPVSASAELKQVIWEEPEVIEETVVEESIWEEPEETETVEAVEVTTPPAPEMSAARRFALELVEEAESLKDEAFENVEIADEIDAECSKEADAIREDGEAIKVAEQYYVEAQVAYDNSIEYLAKKKKEAKEKINEAVDFRNVAEARAKSKIAAMRAARAAGLTYSQYLDQIEKRKEKANAEAIAKAKADSEAKAKAKAEERAKFNAMIPRI